jgi:hypothetical protein
MINLHGSGKIQPRSIFYPFERPVEFGVATRKCLGIIGA